MTVGLVSLLGGVSADAASNPQGEPKSDANDFEINDFRFLATDLSIMHSRLSGNNEYVALNMRKQMADSIMQIYEANGSSISQDEALALVDEQYTYMSGGASVVDTIEASTKSSNSFWNNVPIVNWFIDDTSAEDLFDYMKSGEFDSNRQSEEKTDKVVKTSAVGAAAGTAIGACTGAILGVKIGAMSLAAAGPVGAAVGAGVGLVLGAVFGAFTALIDKNT